MTEKERTVAVVDHVGRTNREAMRRESWRAWAADVMARGTWKSIGSPADAATIAGVAADLFDLAIPDKEAFVRWVRRAAEEIGGDGPLGSAPTVLVGAAFCQQYVAWLQDKART